MLLVVCAVRSCLLLGFSDHHQHGVAIDDAGYGGMLLLGSISYWMM